MGQPLNIIKYLEEDNMFPEEVGVRKRTSSASYKGKSNYAASENYDAFVVDQIQLVTNAEGKEVKSSVHVVFAGYFGFTTLDEFTLPSRFFPNVVFPVSVKEATDNKSGGHHQTVFF